MSAAPEHTLVMTRRFKAPRERVFAAFTSVESMKLWMGPGTCSVVSGTADFREGGEYLLQMTTPHGDLGLRGSYRQITPPALLIYTWQWMDDEAPETLVTIELTAIGDETELRLTQTGFATSESQGNHNHGWNGSFIRLDALLAA